MRNFNIKYFIGITILMIDMILCFTMIYLSHLGYWLLLNEIFGIYFLVSIICIFGLGTLFIILGYASRKFEASIQ